MRQISITQYALRFIANPVYTYKFTFFCVCRCRSAAEVLCSTSLLADITAGIVLGLLCSCALLFQSPVLCVIVGWSCKFLYKIVVNSVNMQPKNPAYLYGMLAATSVVTAGEARIVAFWRRRAQQLIMIYRPWIFCCFLLYCLPRHWNICIGCFRESFNTRNFINS